MLRLPTFIELAAMPDAYLDETRDLLLGYVRMLHFVGAARETRLASRTLRDCDRRAASATTAEEFLSQARGLWDISAPFVSDHCSGVLDPDVLWREP